MRRLRRSLFRDFALLGSYRAASTTRVVFHQPGRGGHVLRDVESISCGDLLLYMETQGRPHEKNDEKCPRTNAADCPSASNATAALLRQSCG